MTLGRQRAATQKRDWTGGEEDGWGRVQKGPQMSSEDVMSSLNRWVASPYVAGNYILCITPAGAAVNATD